MQNTQPCILIVDDEPVNLFLLEELLQPEGYLTLLASSGEEALEIAKASHPDIILLDVMMPDMNGFEVCQQLREDADLQTVPVVFLTALNDETSKLRGLELMGDDYLTKPFKSKFLLTKIANILRLQQLRSQQIEQQVSQEYKEKAKRQLTAAWNINQALSEKLRLFVPDQFLRRIAPTGVESIQLGNAKEEEITVLFCDIRGFTTISESQSAIETFSWLNAFFTLMNTCITANHGFIDKFLGDAIMAVFDRTEYHTQDSLMAAIKMQQSVEEFNCDRDRYNLDRPINIGIGIHRGKGVIGTLGADSRLDSTVIGDVVNTAARLQELTKHYHCGIIASDATIRSLSNNNVNSQIDRSELYSLRRIDRVLLRGKQQEQDIYEVIGTATPPLDTRQVLS